MKNDAQAERTAAVKISAKEAAAELNAHDNILILSHQNPDGDTLGCAFALWRALDAMGKAARVECADPFPPRFSYLFEDCVMPEFEPAYIVAVDIAALQLLGGLRESYGERVGLCIDHHPSNELYAAKTCLHPNAAAACEIIFEVITHLGMEITGKMADCLYTGLATDTGCFRYPSTSAHTHRIAARLFEAGARYEWMNEYLFDTKSKSRIAIEREVLDTVEYFYEGRMAVIYISQAMIERTGAEAGELDGVSAIPRMIEGVCIGVTFREKEDGTQKVSVRTTAEADASAICRIFGGGGHARAAGCVIEAGYEEARARMVEACAAFFPAFF